MCIYNKFMCDVSVLSILYSKRSLQFGKSLLGDETLLSQERQYSKWRLHLFGFSLIWNRPWKQVEQSPPKIGLSTNIPSHSVEIRLPRAHPVLAVPDCNWHEEQDWCFIDGAWEPTLWRILVEVKGLTVLQVQALMGQGVPKKKSWPNGCWAESFGEQPQNENVVFSFARPPLLWSKVTKPSTVGAGESSMLTIAGFVKTGFNSTQTQWNREYCIIFSPSCYETRSACIFQKLDVWWITTIHWVWQQKLECVYAIY